MKRGERWVLSSTTLLVLLLLGFRIAEFAPGIVVIPSVVVIVLEVLILARQIRWFIKGCRSSLFLAWLSVRFAVLFLVQLFE